MSGDSDKKMYFQRGHTLPVQSQSKPTKANMDKRTILNILEIDEQDWTAFKNYANQQVNE